MMESGDSWRDVEHWVQKYRMQNQQSLPIQIGAIASKQQGGLIKPADNTKVVNNNVYNGKPLVKPLLIEDLELAKKFGRVYGDPLSKAINGPSLFKAAQKQFKELTGKDLTQDKLS